jgi:hypothetical protein
VKSGGGFSANISRHPKIENLDGGGLIDDLFLPAGLAAGLPELGGGLAGGQGFIDKNQGQRRQAGAQQGGEGPHLFRGGSRAAVHAQGQPEHQGADAAELGQPRDPLNRIEPDPVDGFNRVGEDPEVIGGGNADAGLAVIDPERGVG